MTNEESMIERLDYCPGLGKSDHVLIKGQLACYSTSVVASSLKWNLSRADFQKLGKKICSTDWSSLSVLDVNTGYQQFRETLLTLMGECIPRSKSTHKRKNIYMNCKAFWLKKKSTSCGLLIRAPRTLLTWPGLGSVVTSSGVLHVS